MTFQSALGRKLQRLGTLPGSSPKPAATTQNPEGALEPGHAAALTPASAMRGRSPEEAVHQRAGTAPSELGIPEPAAPGDSPSATAPAMRVRPSEEAAPRYSGTAPPSALGVPEPTAHGVLNVTLRRYAAEHRHGRVRVGSALAALPSHVAALALDPSLAGAAPERALLLDTETTGLAGGAGTLPFLFGLGWFEPGGSLHLEQLFLARPGEERPMLARLTERLSSASCIVSFNGKSYDWPLLRTRFVMNRMPVPTPPPHLDLLHCARRAFRHRCESARLVELETTVEIGRAHV